LMAIRESTVQSRKWNSKFSFGTRVRGSSGHVHSTQARYVGAAATPSHELNACGGTRQISRELDEWTEVLHETDASGSCTRCARLS
jgi:hypothetical protein